MARVGPLGGRGYPWGASGWNPEDRLRPTTQRIITPEEFRSGRIVPASDPWLIRYLDDHPEEIYSLSPRRFEEMVGDLLTKVGYRVRLGPRGRDGGVDAFAERDGDVGRELILVQCKRHRRDRKVTESIVKQLFADVVLREATRGLIITTSTFTRPALQMIEDVHYRLAGKDIEELRRWLHNVCSQNLRF